MRSGSVDDVALGRKYGYPECCIQAFAAGKVVARTHGGMHETRDDGSEKAWVPCHACLRRAIASGDRRYREWEEITFHYTSDDVLFAEILCAEGVPVGVSWNASVPGAN